MTGEEIPKHELDRAFPDTYDVEPSPGYTNITENCATQASCRFCRAEFETVSARRIHSCSQSHESGQDEIPERVPTILPGVHELGAHLMWAANGLSPYFAIVANFDRVLGKSLYFEINGETWELNHEEKKIKYWQGKLAAREQDAFRAFNEYQIGLRARDSVGRRYVTFQFRPGLPNATHVDTGKPIGGILEDCPESIRVQVHSANVDPEEILDVLHGLMDAMTIDPDHFREEDLHQRSRCYNLALYVRMTREENEEKIVSRNGLLEQLALVSSQQRGRGEYKWDNEEIIGHRTAVAIDTRSLEKLLPDQHVGKLLKSYHMKTPTATETDSATTSPKLDVQYSTEYSDPERQSVP